jgi:hypothetical protein
MGYDDDYGEYHGGADHFSEAIPYGAFWLLSHVVFWGIMLFGALGMAAGLFYLAELAEEYTVLARKIMRCLIIGTAAIFLLLKLVDGFSWWRCLLSIGGQAVYYQLLINFPWVSLKSPAFIGSCVVFVVDHALWYSYFLPGYDGGKYPHWAVLTFFVMLWLVPMGYFTCLVVADQALPSTLGNETAAPKRRTLASIVQAFLPRGLTGADKRN